MLARRILRLLGTRYGIIAIIVVVVVIVVGAARLNSGPSNDTSRHNTGEEHGAHEDGDGHEHVDGFDDSQEDLNDDLVQLPPEAVDAAVAFAKDWVNPNDAEQEEWFEAISAGSTKNLQEQLEATDPEVVPATEIVGKPDAKANNVEIETDAGLLTLRVIKEDGAWKVDGIDFENP